MSYLPPQDCLQVVKTNGGVMEDPFSSDEPVYIRCSGECLPTRRPVSELISRGGDIYRQIAELQYFEIVESPEEEKPGCLTMCHVGYMTIEDPKICTKRPALKEKAMKSHTKKKVDSFPYGQFDLFKVPHLGHIHHPNPIIFRPQVDKIIIIVAAVLGKKRHERNFFALMKPESKEDGLCELYTVIGVLSSSSRGCETARRPCSERGKTTGWLRLIVTRYSFR